MVAILSWPQCVKDGNITNSVMDHGIPQQKKKMLEVSESSTKPAAYNACLIQVCFTVKPLI